MSLLDITLNSEVYTVISVAGSKVIRKVLAPSTSGFSDQIMEIAHTPGGAGRKPGRHMVKFSVKYTNGTSGLIYPMSIHTVFTCEDSMAANFAGAGNVLTDNMVDYISPSNYVAVPLLIGGGFS